MLELSDVLCGRVQFSVCDEVWCVQLSGGTRAAPLVAAVARGWL